MANKSTEWYLDEFQKSDSQMLKTRRGVLSACGRQIPFGVRTLIMGVVNVTPDSFSGDGVLNAAAASKQALDLERAGADIVDIGGESTRPGYESVSEEEECRRILPVLSELKGKLNAVLSVDSTKPAVLRQAAAHGAGLLNSILGLDTNLLKLAAEINCPLVIMHNKARIESDCDILDEVLRYLESAANQAIAIGLKEDQIILDPGIGFGKSPDQNIDLLRSLERLTTLGFPSMIGTSRKSTIGKITGRSVTERNFGTAATVALAIAAGIDIVRVHDVAEILDVVKMSDSIIRNWRPEGWES